MAPTLDLDGLRIDENGEPTLSHSYTLKFIGDWGSANFHRICSWLTQEFCDRTGPQSRTLIWNLRDGALTDSLDITFHLCELYPSLMPSQHRNETMKLLKELHEIQYLSLSSTAADKRMEVIIAQIQMRLAAEGISEKYREALDFKKKY
jgi:hypothetical protein